MTRKVEAWADILLYKPGLADKRAVAEIEKSRDVQWLKERGASVTVCTNAAAMRQRLSTHAPTLVLLDFAAGEESIDSVEIESLHHIRPSLRFVALVNGDLVGSPIFADLVRKRLLYDYQTLPLDRDRLLFVVGHVRGLVEVERQHRAARPIGTENAESEPFMVGSHPAMLRVFSTIRKVARTDTPVLVTGESGTGKELVANAVHERSPFREGPFVAINCAAIPSTLIASELFGHEKGAFTDARERKLGKIESASNGTLFLDEIGDLPLELQGHLLRFLQEKTIERVGGTRTIQVTTRVIAATNVDLWEAVEAGKFRKDLFYRLNVLPIHLPPLRERGNDIELVARYFLQRFSSELERPDLEFKSSAIAAIRNYGWPGNVRELISVIRRAVVMAESRCIDASDLDLPVSVDDGGRLPTIEEARYQAEQEAIQRALHKHNDNINRAAKELCVSRVTLYRLIEKHAIVYTPRGRKRVADWTPDIEYIN